MLPHTSIQWIAEKGSSRKLGDPESTRRGAGENGEDRPLDDSHTYQTREADSTNRSPGFNGKKPEPPI